MADGVLPAVRGPDVQVLCLLHDGDGRPLADPHRPGRVLHRDLRVPAGLRPRDLGGETVPHGAVFPALDVRELGQHHVPHQLPGGRRRLQQHAQRDRVAVRDHHWPLPGRLPGHPGGRDAARGRLLVPDLLRHPAAQPAHSAAEPVVRVHLQGHARLREAEPGVAHRRRHGLLPEAPVAQVRGEPEPGQGARIRRRRPRPARGHPDSGAGERAPPVGGERSPVRGFHVAGGAVARGEGDRPRRKSARADREAHP
mmetsp:Transcript_96707/g.273892  ORF Transcript_96707/g.273892 Transcript_96707/m.273892 type:complete len:254 (-) Transcript_96707:372-1133(-)